MAKEGQSKRQQSSPQNFKSLRYNSIGVEEW